MWTSVIGAVGGLAIGGSLGVLLDRILLALRAAIHTRARNRGEVTPTNLIPMGLWKPLSLGGAIIGGVIVN